MEIWFSDFSTPNIKLDIRVTRQLFSGMSDIQQVDVFDSVDLGRFISLDGEVVFSEKDEFIYDEMVVHVPMAVHPRVRKVLVIGGGDGGVLREAGKHPELEVMDICEIDAEVIETAKKFFPNVSCGYDDPRVAVHIADGSEFIKDRPGYYDVIIVDSTDPGGPGAPLFGEQFYRDMKKALRPGGVIATQAESPYLLPDIVQRLYKVSEQVFRSVGYASILVPTYPTGTIGACVAGDRDDIASPARPVPSELAAKLRYYNSKIHEAAFANPSFVKRLFD